MLEAFSSLQGGNVSLDSFHFGYYASVMKLDAWLETSGTRDNVFAKRIGVSRVTLFRIKTGRRIPEREVMEKISAETDGAVTPNDFYDIGEPGALKEEAAA